MEVTNQFKVVAMVIFMFLFCVSVQLSSSRHCQLPLTYFYSIQNRIIYLQRRQGLVYVLLIFKVLVACELLPRNHRND